MIIYSNIPSNCINFNDLCCDFRFYLLFPHLYNCVYSPFYYTTFIRTQRVFKVIMLFKREFCNLSKPLSSVLCPSELRELVKNSNYSFWNFKHLAWFAYSFWDCHILCMFYGHKIGYMAMDMVTETDKSTHTNVNRLLSTKYNLKSNSTRPLNGSSDLVSMWHKKIVSHIKMSMGKLLFWAVVFDLVSFFGFANGIFVRHVYFTWLDQRIAKYTDKSNEKENLRE